MSIATAVLAPVVISEIGGTSFTIASLKSFNAWRVGSKCEYSIGIPLPGSQFAVAPETPSTTSYSFV